MACDFPYCDFSLLRQTNYVDVTLRDHQFIPNADLFLGLRWDGYVNKQKQHVGVGLGWETQYWWSQYRELKQVAYGGSNSMKAWPQDLSIQGVTLKVKIDF